MAEAFTRWLTEKKHQHQLDSEAEEASQPREGWRSETHTAANTLTLSLTQTILIMQRKFVSFKCSINFKRVQNISICRSSSAVMFTTDEDPWVKVTTVLEAPKLPLHCDQAVMNLYSIILIICALTGSLC